MRDTTSTNKVNQRMTSAPILSNLKTDQDEKKSGRAFTKSKPKPRPRESLLAKEQANEPPAGPLEPGYFGRKLQDHQSGVNDPTSHLSTPILNGGKFTRGNRNRRRPHRKRKKSDLRVGKLPSLIPFFVSVSFSELSSSLKLEPPAYGHSGQCFGQRSHPCWSSRMR